MNFRRTSPVLLLVLGAACAYATSPSGSGRLAPLVEPEMSLDTRLVDNEYIVVLREGGDEVSAARRATGRGGQVVASWHDALLGYAVRGGPSLILGLRGDPDVAYVEQVQEYSINTTQSGATWGLDRIDQRNLPLSTTYTYSNTGAGVRAYIIDTGIRTTHAEFGARATHGYDFVDNDAIATDCHGHGTHVAGTVGGITYGVAKGVSLIAVRVLNCSGSGTTSGVISGINFVAASGAGARVANMSLGGGKSTTLNNAVTNAVSAGVTFAVAAGNSNRDACKFSPASAASAITVGATTSTDSRASYSNYGACLDIFAPGSSITSAWSTSNSATNTISGTSMATPHVAGVAALYLQGNPGATPANVAAALIAASTPNKVTSAGRNSPNRLLFTSY